MRRRALATCFAAAIALIGLPCVASAATIDVLWYTGGVENFDGDYRDDIDDLASLAPGAPGGNTWTVTFWEGGAIPAGTFDVIVTASPQGAWDADPDYSALETALDGGLELGDRQMVTGQDADWHYMNNPDLIAFDGPSGFLLDAINWAGSGTGMGAVFLGYDGADFNLSGFTLGNDQGDDVVIPAEFAGLPINTGLTSAGLSNWGTSAHQTYTDLDPGMWVAINTLGEGGDAITIISARTAGGDITPVPEPATMSLLGLGVAGIVAAKLRRRKT